MKSSDLNPEDAKLLLTAFRAAADGPFPELGVPDPHGFRKVELQQLIAQWPSVTDEDLFALAASNVLNNLLGYPHGQWDAWRDYSSATPQDLANLAQ